MARARVPASDVDIFGTDPYGLGGGTSASGAATYVPPPRLPQVQTGPSTGGTGTRTIPSPVPAPDVPDTTPQTTANAFSQPALWSYLQGYPHTPAGLQAAYAANPAIFGGATIIGSKGDKLQLPTGQVVDVIQSAGTGGNAWQWLEGGGTGGQMGSYFTDPTQQFLMGAMDTRLQDLQRLMGSQPSLAQLTQLVNQYVGANSGAQVKPEAYQGAINALSQALTGQRPQNAQLPEVTANLRTRIGELRQAPFSAGDEAALQARAYDQLEKDRTAAKARVLEELGAKGHAATSGTVARALQQVDQAFDQYRAQNTNQLALYGYEQKQQRGQTADALELQLAQLGGIDQSAEMAWKQQQLAAGMNAAQLDLGWQQEVQRRYQAAMQAAAALQGLQQGQWSNQNLLSEQAFQTSATPYTMGLSSMNAANNVLTGQTNTMQALQALSGLSNQQAYQNQVNTGNTAAYLNAFLRLIGALV